MERSFPQNAYLWVIFLQDITIGTHTIQLSHLAGTISRAEHRNLNWHGGKEKEKISDYDIPKKTWQKETERESYKKIQRLKDTKWTQLDMGSCFYTDTHTHTCIHKEREEDNKGKVAF